MVVETLRSSGPGGMLCTYSVTGRRGGEKTGRVPNFPCVRELGSKGADMHVTMSCAVHGAARAFASAIGMMEAVEAEM